MYVLIQTSWKLGLFIGEWKTNDTYVADLFKLFISEVYPTAFSFISRIKYGQPEQY